MNPKFRFLVGTRFNEYGSETLGIFLLLLFFYKEKTPKSWGYLKIKQKKVGAVHLGGQAATIIIIIMKSLLDCTFRD